MEVFKFGGTKFRREPKPGARAQHLGCAHRARSTKAAGGRELW